MRRRPGPRVFLLAALLGIALALLAGAPLAASAQGDATPPPRIYRWIDSNGIAHYTTNPKRVPSALRPEIPESPPSAPPAQAGAKSGVTGAAHHAGPDAWASMNRGEKPPPSRSLHTAPFSEGGAEGVAKGNEATTGKPPAVGANAPSAAGAVGGSSAAGAEANAAPPETQAKLDDLDYQIAQLEAGIKADEKQIATHLSNPKGGGPLASGDDPKLRELAVRLPERLKELHKLQDERARLVQK